MPYPLRRSFYGGENARLNIIHWNALPARMAAGNGDPF